MVDCRGHDAVTGPSRDDTMRKLQDAISIVTARVRDTDEQVDALDWDVIGFLCEGLAFGGRPLGQATQAVTRQYDLGPRGAWILNLISNGIVYPLDLANVFRVGRSLITAELARLTEAGLITARPGATDRRRSELALTAAGEAAGTQIREDMSAIIPRNLAGYTPQEVLKFAQMLRDVRGDDNQGC